MNIICDRYCTYLHINETGVFYVGCGSKGRAKDRSHRTSPWKQAADDGYSVLILGEFADQQDAWEHEKELIAYFKPSCNKAIGGHGATGYVHTPEARDKVRVANLGENNPHHRLTKEQVLAIREDTRTQRTIAAEYEITPPQVSHIKSRRIWKHI